VWRAILRRVLHALLVLLVVSLITFGLIMAAPGGPAILLDPDLTPADRARLRREMGLDAPVPVQYARWLASAAQGDLGRSLVQKRRVTEMIAERIPATAALAGAGLALTLLVGIPLGVAAATRPRSVLDRAATIASGIGIAIPGFWFGIMLIIVFAVWLRWLPSAGMYAPAGSHSLGDLLVHLVLPSVVLATFSLPQVTLFTRASLLEALRQDYVRTARAKGLDERPVLYRHALRNALIPVITIIGLLLPRLVGGAVITETVFAWPGMGRLSAEAAFGRDYPLIMGITMVVSVVVIVSNLLADLAYTVVDPRIRLEKEPA
jgi:peptide/nickel transport system permease protein